jgi:hypothetical protein
MTQETAPWAGLSIRNEIALALDAAYLAGERRGRERAAEVAENTSADGMGYEIACDIRALPDEEPR